MKRRTEVTRVALLEMKSSYGQDRIYPINDTAQNLAVLTGRKTLLPDDLTVIEKLGFTIQWIHTNPAGARSE